MYNPSVGRFATEDPMEFGAGDDNLYRFVGNDPTNAMDPSGTVAALLDTSIQPEVDVHPLTFGEYATRVGKTVAMAYQADWKEKLNGTDVFSDEYNNWP